MFIVSTPNKKWNTNLFVVISNPIFQMFHVSFTLMRLSHFSKLKAWRKKVKNSIFQKKNGNSKKRCVYVYVCTYVWSIRKLFEKCKKATKKRISYHSRSSRLQSRPYFFLSLNSFILSVDLHFSSPLLLLLLLLPSPKATHHHHHHRRCRRRRSCCRRSRTGRNCNCIFLISLTRLILKSW